MVERSGSGSNQRYPLDAPREGREANEYLFSVNDCSNQESSRKNSLLLLAAQVRDGDRQGSLAAFPVRCAL